MYITLLRKASKLSKVCLTEAGMIYKQKKFLQTTLDKIFGGNQTNHGISDKKKHLSFFAYIFDHYCQKLFVEGCLGYPAPTSDPRPS